jgi:hypothetical protein
MIVAEIRFLLLICLIIIISVHLIRLGSWQPLLLHGAKWPVAFKFNLRNYSLDPIVLMSNGSELACPQTHLPVMGSRSPVAFHAFPPCPQKHIVNAFRCAQELTWNGNTASGPEQPFAATNKDTRRTMGATWSSVLQSLDSGSGRYWSSPCNSSPSKSSSLYRSGTSCSTPR